MVTLLTALALDTHTIVLYALAGVGAVGTLVCSAIFLFVLCARPF